MSEVFYVYEHIRNDTNEIFYVGKGKVGSGRCNSRDSRNRHWMSIVAKAKGFKVNKIIENISEQNAFEIEIQHIQELKSKGINLCNQTNGGEGKVGWNPTAETRTKMRLNNTGKKNYMFGRTGDKHPNFGKILSPEARRKISIDRMGDKNPNFGKKMSDEQKKKISESKKGSIPHNLGKKMSDEQKKKMSESKKGRKPSKEARANMRAAQIGRKHSEETKMKMQASALARPPIPVVTCPQCGKTGKSNGMKRFHFDNCRNK